VFLVVRVANRLQKPAPAAATNKDCPYCKTSIPVGALRCPNCTSDLGRAA
jgi:large conductance mechanosensitive channel